MSLPIIDFSPFLSPSSTSSQKRNAAKEIDKACREVGFFYISNHGISSELTQAMLDNARTFFETSTPEEKIAIAIREAGDGIGDNARGWQSVHGGKKGSHECVDIFRPIEPTPNPPYEVGQGINQWPLKPPSFRSTSEQYVEAVCSLGTEVVKAMALGLEIEEELFTSRIDRSFWNLRILSYEPTTPSTLTDQEKEKISGIGEHTDFGILTFLLTDPTPDSLQVLSKEGTWIPANPIPGCFLCNIGDMLATWTGGLYKSTRHRVLHNSDRRRISIPLFFDPNMDARIEPVLPRGVKRADEGVLYKEKFVKAIKYSVVV